MAQQNDHRANLGPVVHPLGQPGQLSHYIGRRLLLEHPPPKPEVVSITVFMGSERGPLPPMYVHAVTPARELRPAGVGMISANAMLFDSMCRPF